MCRFLYGCTVLASAFALLAIDLSTAFAANDRPIVVEGESLVRAARSTQGRVAEQDMRGFGRTWSGNAQLSWVPPQDGHQLYLTVPRAGDRRV